jgi:hypothetical protein
MSRRCSSMRAMNQLVLNDKIMTVVGRWRRGIAVDQ